jgi:hypothetical protein
MSTSAPTKRMTSPWIRVVRLEASSGRKISGSRFRVDVPVVRAAKRNPARPTPRAVFRPSSANVVRVDPELPADDVHRAREPGEHPRDRHREEVVASDGDAAVARRLRVVPDRAHLVAEGRPVERDPVGDQRRARSSSA